MLVNRLATGAVLITLLVVGLVIDQRLAPWFPVWFVISLVVMSMSALEVVELLSATSAKPSGNTVFGGVLALILANWAPHVVGHLSGTSHLITIEDAAAASHVLSWPLWAFVAIVMFAFINQSAQFHTPGGTMARIAGTVLATAYVGLLGSFIVQFRWLDGPQNGLLPLVTLIATAKGSDTGAYTLGRIAGKHKLWPRLSPNKTIEGALGGLAFGVGAASLVAGIGRFFHVATLSWPATIVFGVLVGAAAQLGDLMESMIKRTALRKDSSSTLPGFGGVLDVMDSLLFAAPVGYGLWLCCGH